MMNFSTLLLALGLLCLGVKCEDWDAEIDSFVDKLRPNADKACIVGLDGTMWTTGDHEKNLKLSPVEAGNIAAIVKEDDKSLERRGFVKVEGVIYDYVEIVDTDNKTILFKKNRSGWITLTKTEKAVLVVHAVEDVHWGMIENVVSNVEEVADHIEHLGY